MIEQELKALRDYVTYFDNSPGQEPFVGRYDIQEALKPVLAALEKLAATPAVPDKWIDPEGDEWTFDAEQRVLRWEHGARRVFNGRIEALSHSTGHWRSNKDSDEQQTFYRRMWTHFTGEI